MLPEGKFPRPSRPRRPAPRRTALPLVALAALSLAAACVPGTKAPQVSPRGTLRPDEAARGKASEGGPFRVVSATPSGQTDQPTEVAIVFSEPARALGLGPHDPPPPASIKPEVKGSWEWVGTRALRFSPSEPFPRGTSFEVEVSPRARSIKGEELGKPHVVRFSTERPRLVRTDPHQGASGLEPSAHIKAFFDQPVSDDEAKRALRLLAGKAPLDFELKRPEPKDGSVVELWPRAPLPLASTVTLEVDPSLRGVEGPLPSGKAYSSSFTTYGPLEVTGLDCSRDETRRCTPGRWVELNLSNPVRLADLRKALEIDPPVKLSLPPAGDEVTQSLYLDGRFAPGQSYTIRLKSELAGGKGPLKDRFGQPMRRPFSARVSFGDRPTEVAVGVLGTYLEPSSSNEIPVFAVNAKKLTVTTAALDVEQAVLREASEGSSAPPPNARARQLPPGAKNRVDRHVIRADEVLGAKGARGPVWVETSWEDGGREAKQEQVVQVTDIGITAKSSPLGGLVWVTRLSTGKPLAGAQVEIRAPGQAQPVFTAAADEGGLAVVPSGKVPDLPGGADYVVVARSGADWAYRGFGRSVGLWRYGVDTDYAPGGAVGLVFTERGIYRPTDAVRVKAVVRVPDQKRLTTPAGRKATLVVRGPEGEEIGSFEETLSAFGTFDRTVQLPPGAKLGRYAIEAHLGGKRAKGKAAAGDENAFAGGFEVAEYRPSEIKVSAETDRASYVRGDAMTCVSKGAYLFGAPMPGAEARTSLTRGQAYFQVPDLDGFTTSDETYASAHRGSTPRAGELENKQEKLDARGETRASTRLDLPGQSGTETVSCETEVTDLSRQTFAGRASALVHPGELYVGLRSGRDLFVSSGDTLSPEVVAADPTGKRRSGVKVKVELFERRWTLARQAAGASYHTDVTIEDKLVGECSAVTGAKSGSCQLKVPQAGELVLRATLTDSRGNQVHASEVLYALGDGAAGFADGDEQRVELVADKKSYKIGDTARVLIKSPFAQAEALVTVEREGVISQRRLPVSGPMPTVDIPVTEAFVPNAYVSVMLVRGRTKAPPKADKAPDVGAPAFRLGYASLAVDHDSRRLRVEIKPSKTEARPGETVDVEVAVKDAQGKGVRGEVALYAADEGVLSLIGYKTPDPVATFFAPRGLGVRTVEAREAIGRVVRSGAAVGIDKGLEGGGGGEGPRRDLRQTALWEPALATDEQGRARARFKLPDGLTTYRLMAVATGADDRFGSAEGGITTSKPLMVRPALPRVLRAGDRLEASALVTSKGAAGKITVEVSAEGLSLSGEASRQIDLSPGQTAEVRFPMEAPRAGRAKLRFRAQGGGADDAIELSREVLTPTMLEAAALYGDTTTASGERLGDLGEIRDDVGGLELGLSSTALTGLSGGVEQLVEYPYGCTEQLTSRLVPLLPLRDLARDFGLALPADVDEAVTATVGKVLANQHPDGGFGLWKESADSSPFLTAYALWGLGEAGRRGVAVRKQSLEAATRYLRQSLRFDDVQRGAEASFVLDVLAENGEPDQGAMAKLFEQRATLPVFARAELLHAMARAEASRESVSQLATELASTLRIDGPFARAVSADEHAWERLLDSSTRTSALVLRALVAAEPKHPMAPKLAMALLADRRGGRWRTTQESAWALLALDAYRRAQEGPVPDFDARVFLGEAQIAEAPFHDRQTLGARSQVPMSRLGGASGQVLAFEVKGQGHLFYEARLRFARKQMPAQAEDGGFFVEKRARVVSPDELREGKLPSPEGLPPRVSAGDLVLVDLTVVAPSPRQFVVLDDPLPAGLEPVDSRLASSASWLSLGRKAAVRAASDDDGDGDEGEERYRPGAPLTRQEMRDDRVLFFADQLPAGVFHYRYLARATSIGRFASPPTRIEEMYTPETFGRTGGSQLEVAPR